MLNRLTIKNIALIEELEIDLSGGMNVLSGETGAGKSIIVDAVNLVLGERADRDLIRTGAEKAVVEAWFSGVQDSLDDILSAQEIEPQQELVLSRELSVNGRNVCRANGVLVTLGVLKAISDRIVDLHGQHEHQSLMNEKNHIGMLDGFDSRIGEAKAYVSRSFEEYAGVKKRLKSLFGDPGDRERRIDILQFQIDEILKANIFEGEELELLAQKKRMNEAENIMGALSDAYASLYESDSFNVLASLNNIGRRFQSIEDVDERYREIAEKINDTYYVLEEIAEDIRGEMEECVFDADSLEQIEERLNLISNLKRKYNDPLVTGAYISKAEQELNDLVDSERLVHELTEKEAKLKRDLYQQSVQLSDIRKETAKVFEEKMMRQLFDLGMAAASFSVHFQDLQPIEETEFSRNGIDTVEFYISTNKGEPQKPLRKIASGGEISRIMLALKNIAADKGGIPTMIFDEIDTGISGKMAQVVAEKLYSISKGRQVFCVTHLPQIASMADKHFLVEKQSDETMTKTYLKPLSGQERIEEIARLAGGSSSVTQQHVKEMLQTAEHIKTTI